MNKATTKAKEESNYPSVKLTKKIDIRDNRLCFYDKDLWPRLIKGLNKFLIFLPKSMWNDMKMPWKEGFSPKIIKATNICINLDNILVFIVKTVN